MRCALCYDCREGNTALHLACQSNQLKAIEVLLQWGARANMTNASGFAPVSALSTAMVSTLQSFVLTKLRQGYPQLLSLGYCLDQGTVQSVLRLISCLALMLVEVIPYNALRASCLHSAINA